MILNSWRKRLSKEEFPLARKRAASLPTAELFNATEAHLFYVGQSLEAWRRGAGTDAMDEAHKNILCLLEITRELSDRSLKG